MGWRNEVRGLWAGFMQFKLHLVVNHMGGVVAAKLTQANVDDRVPVRELAANFRTGYMETKAI